MFTLGSFFSAFTLHNSNLEELCKKEDLTLEEILDEDNIVQEVKSAPQKFAKIIQQHPNLIKNMLDYIIREPSLYESDQKKCFKYPFITSEIFGAEVKGFINMFFDLSTEEERGHFRGYDGMDAESDDKGDDHEFKRSDDEDDEEDVENNKHGEEEKTEEANEGKEGAEVEDDPKEGSDGTPQSKSKKNPNTKRQSETLGTKNIDYLFKFLETKEVLNTTLAGYFQKAVNAFLNKRAEDFFSFLFSNLQHQDNLVRHVSTKSVSDILIRVFMMDINYSESKGNDAHFLNERKDMIDKLFEIFATSDNHEEQENISNIFSEIINKNNNCNAGKELVETIVSEKFLDIIFKKILSNDSYPILYASTILLCLVQHYYQDKSSEGSPSKKNGDEDVVVQSDFDYNALFSTLEKNLPSIIEILQQDSNINEFSTSFGARVKPLGCGKLKVIELLNYCFKITTPPNLINILLEKKIFGVLLKLCAKYEWNNFLHSAVEKIIFTALESEHSDIKKGLLEEYNIIDELIKYVMVEDFQVDSKVDKNLRRGYRAYFIKILKYIQKLSITNDYLKKKLDDSAAWKEFEEVTLKKITEDENKDLGGHNPKKSKQPDEEVDNSKLELDIQKIYQRFSHYFSSSQQKDDDNDDMDMDNQEIYEDIDKHNGDGDADPKDNYLDGEESLENHIHSYHDMIDKGKAEALQRGPEMNHRIDEEEINMEYSLNTYWKNDTHLHHDVDELMTSNGLK